MSCDSDSHDEGWVSGVHSIIVDVIWSYAD